LRILYLTYMPVGVGQTIRSLECAKAASDLGHNVTLAFLNRHFRAPEFCYDMMAEYQAPGFRALTPPSLPMAATGPQVKSAIGRIMDCRPTLRGLYRQVAASLKFVPRELRLIDEYRPDVMVVRPDLVFSFMVSSKLRGVPLVLETDGPVEELDQRWGLDSRWIAPLDTWRARNSDALMYISRECSGLWERKGIPREKLFYVANGVSNERFRPSVPQAKAVLRARYGLKEGKVIGFSGNLREWHGVDELIRAALPLLAEDPDLKLLFIGAVDDPKALDRQQVTDSIRARQFVFTGPVPYADMGAHIDLADCMALPFPWSECFYPSAMKLFEAMSVGKLIVAPRMGQLAEVLEGLASPLLYDPREAGALNRSLRAALSRVADAGPGSVLAPDARSRIQAAHTWAHRGEAVAQACEYARARAGRERIHPRPAHRGGRAEALETEKA
jgi:glycosyltransferase involved in cell wall biosynthesis